MKLGVKLPHARRITAACMKLAPPPCCDEAEAGSEQALADVVDEQEQEVSGHPARDKLVQQEPELSEN